MADTKSLGEQDNPLADTQDDRLTVQVLNLGREVHALTFQERFEHICKMKNIGISAPSGFRIVVEVNVGKNFAFDGKKSALVDEFFMKFSTEEDVRFVLVLGKLDVMMNSRCSRLVEFVKPARNEATRAAYRRIYQINERLPDIGREFKSMGAIRQEFADKPQLSGDYMSKAEFKVLISAMEIKRKAGENLSAFDMSVLKRTRIVDTGNLNARIDELYNEEQDAWLELGKYKMMGLDEFGL